MSGRTGDGRRCPEGLVVFLQLAPNIAPALKEGQVEHPRVGHETVRLLAQTFFHVLDEGVEAARLGHRPELALDHGRWPARQHAGRPTLAAAYAAIRPREDR